MQGKKVSESRVTIQHQVLPRQTNSSGNMHGGELLRMLDSAGAICAFRHARGSLVTAAIEHMSFIAPVRPGDIIMFHCSVNYVKRTSMEVGVRIEAEDYQTGEVRHVSKGYLTFVGIDKSGKPRVLPPLIPETEEDKRRMLDAARRMAIARMGNRKTDNFDYCFSLIEQNQIFALCEFSCFHDIPQELLSDMLSIVQEEHKSFFGVFPQKLLSTENEAYFSQIKKDYSCLAINEEITSNTIGVLANISAVLGEAKVSVFVFSTLNTNFILFPLSQREKAINALSAVGHNIQLASTKK